MSIVLVLSHSCIVCLFVCFFNKLVFVRNKPLKGKAIIRPFWPSSLLLHNFLVFLLYWMFCYILIYVFLMYCYEIKYWIELNCILELTRGKTSMVCGPDLAHGPPFEKACSSEKKCLINFIHFFFLMLKSRVSGLKCDVQLNKVG